MATRTRRYLVREVADDDMVRAIAEEAGLNDRALDVLELRLVAEGVSPGERAALGLTIGRCGRPRSANALHRAAERALRDGAAVEAEALKLALDLLRWRPPERVGRAESGYVYTDLARDLELFVEDPVAGYWHRKGRWGPPIRPDLARSPKVAGPGSTLERLVDEIADGGSVLVTFAPRRFGRPEPPLYLLSAGLARDPGLRTLVRWSQVRSAGLATRRGARVVAFEVLGEPLELLPPGSALPVDVLLALLGRLLERAHA